MKLLLLACLVSFAWLVLLAGAVVVHRIAEDVRRWRSWRNQLEQTEERTDGHA